MDNTISFVLPLRGGSKRVEKKNVKDFCDVKGGLTKIKLDQLVMCDFVDNIYVTTDDQDVIEIAKEFNDPRIIIDIRPQYLCQSNTKIEDLISYIGELVSSDHIFWVHATSPFVNSNTYRRAWLSYRESVIESQQYDSLMSVTRIQQFLWSDSEKGIINKHNFDTRWPQTQDLEPLYEINHAFYINQKSNYNDRIGLEPLCFELDKKESIDIDYPDDFEFAELLFRASNEVKNKK